MPLCEAMALLGAGARVQREPVWNQCKAMALVKSHGFRNPQTSLLKVIAVNEGVNHVLKMK